MYEQWRPIDGWPYEVSSEGRIRRSEPGAHNTWVGKILTGSRDRGGYRHFKLYRDGEWGTHSLHAAACTAFHGPRPEGQEVRHLNNVKANNRSANLAWGTQTENASDRDYATGERHALAKLTDEQVAASRARYAAVKAGKAGRTQVPPGWAKREASRLGISNFALYKMLTGQTYKRA